MSKAVKLLDDIISELEILTKIANPAETITANGTSMRETKESKIVVATTEAVHSDLDISSIDMRVGVITRVFKHETAEKLYCEEIDVGEDAPRSIASGVVKYYTLDEMQNRRLIVVCNLKPRNLVGFKSNGMVLCVAKDIGNGEEKVEFLDPPADAKPGDRVMAKGFGGDPLTANQCDKKKAFEKIAADLNLVNGVAMWKDIPLVCNGQTLSSATLTDGKIR